MRKLTKKFLSLILLIIIFTLNININNIALANTNGIDTINIQNFLNTIDNIHPNVAIGSEIPTYIIENNTLVDSDVKYYPLLDNNEVVGFIGYYKNGTNKPIITHTTAYNNVINNFVKSNKNIALVGDQQSFNVISNKSKSILFGKSINYKNNDNITFSNIKKISNLYIKDKNNNTSSSNSSKVALSGSGLNIPIKKQSTPYSCWAACVASVGQYKTSLNYTDTYIVNYTGIDYGGDGNDMFMALWNIYKIDTYFSYDKFFMSSLIADINNYKPIIAVGKYNDFIHGVVISGYGYSSSSASFSYMDPNDGALHNMSVSKDGELAFISGGSVFSMFYHLHLR